MKDNSAINAIILKAITGEELTLTESTKLKEYLAADEENREFVEKWKNSAYQLQKLKEIHAIDVQGGKPEVEQKQSLGKQISINRRKTFRDVATSAAAVLILAAALFYWLHRKKDKEAVIKEEVKTAAQQDVAPGKANALLTLANGSMIVLDSNRNGQLARQGGAVVLNENNTLKYREEPGLPKVVLYNTVSTANAQTYTMVLSDGSKVWLNTGASIRFPVVFTGNERRVAITGEAYFEVAHNAGKPFIVHVSGKQGKEIDVQVLGTHFNINAYHDEAAIKTTLLEGSVKIKYNNYQTLLKPGQQSQVGSGTPQVINNVSVEAVTAWKNGKIIFENADIDAVMRQLTRWYNIEVVYEGAKPAQRFIGPLDRNISLSRVVFILEYMTGIHFRIDGRKLIVLSSTPDDSSKNTKPHT